MRERESDICIRIPKAKERIGERKRGRIKKRDLHLAHRVRLPAGA